MQHFAALDDFGGVFIPPNCDNTYEQSTKGLGAEDLDNPTEGSDLRYGSLHVGFGTDFNYFPHIPRPGYVKETEWNQQFYNDITLKNSCYKNNTPIHWEKNFEPWCDPIATHPRHEDAPVFPNRIRDPKRSVIGN